jgi:thymidylate synthase (FAD)
MRNISEGVDGYSAEEWAKFLRWENEQRNMMEQCFILYREHIGEGMPRELARGVLPVATYSHMFGTVDLHNLFHFLKLRLHPHAQYEIRVYAAAMLELIEPIVPISTAAFREHILGA